MRILRLEPESADVLHKLGYAVAQRGDRQQAVEYYRRALAIDSEMFEVHNNLGLLLHSGKDFETAIAHFEKALEIDPDSGKNTSR